jgi:hypothetical protein
MDDGLRNEHAIEWIAMQGRQPRHVQCGLFIEAQGGDAARGAFLGQVTLGRI